MNASNAKAKSISDAFDDNDNNNNTNNNNNHPVQNGKRTWNNNSNNVENRNQKNASLTPTPVVTDNGNAQKAPSKAPLTPHHDAFGDFEFPATNEVDFFADFNNTFQQKPKQTTSESTTDAFGLGANESTLTKNETTFGSPTDRCLGNLSHKSAFSTNYTALTNDTHEWNIGNNKFIDDHFDEHLGSLTTTITQPLPTATAILPPPLASPSPTLPPLSNNDINMNPDKLAKTKSLSFNDNDSFADFGNAFDAFEVASRKPERIVHVFPTQQHAAATVKDVVDGAGIVAGVWTDASANFLNDYSKTDDFESDLQLVLQRSLIDQ